MERQINLNYKIWKPFGNLYRKATTLVLIENEAGEILVSTKLDYPKNIWRFIGGGVSEGEAPENCIIRELEEELFIKNVVNVNYFADYNILATDSDGKIYNHKISAFYLKLDINLAVFDKNEISMLKFIKPNKFVDLCKKNCLINKKFISEKTEFEWSDFAKIYGDIQIDMTEKVFGTTENILLLDTSVFGTSNYLEYAESELKKFLGIKPLKILIIPFATSNLSRDSSYVNYEFVISKAFKRLGQNYKFIKISEGNLIDNIDSCDVIFVGGGNCHRLLFHLKKLNIFGRIKKAIIKGKKYIGVSAGSTLVGRNLDIVSETTAIKPSNTDGFDLLGNKNIICHHNDSDSRELRILQEFAQDTNRKIISSTKGSICSLVANKKLSIVTGRAYLIDLNVKKEFYEINLESEIPTSTPNFILVLPDLKHAKDMHDYSSNEHFTKYTSISQNQSIDDVKLAIRSMINFNKISQNGKKLLIKDTLKNKIIGGINLKIVGSKTSKIYFGEISIGISQKYCKQGLGTSLVKDLLKFSTDYYGLKEFKYQSLPENIASINLAKKSGFEYKKTILKSIVLKGIRYDKLVFEKTVV